MSDIKRNKFISDEDLINTRIKDFTVLGIAGRRGNPPRTYYTVRCERCGRTLEVRKNVLLAKGKEACSNCLAKERGSTCTRNNFEDPEYLNNIIGMHINKLTCKRFVGFKEEFHKTRNKMRRHAMYEFECDCGNTTIVERNLFLKGKIKSCGCANYIGVVTHDGSRTRLYHIWQNMKNRCYNPNTQRYDQYGGRGIYVCPEWLGNTPEEGFVNFRDWALSNGYEDHLSIDRIDVNGPYAPWNCRWATDEEQGWNKQNTILVEVLGHMYNALDISRIYNTNISLKTLSRRLGNEDNHYNDWSFNDKLYVTPGLSREDYRKMHNIKNVFEELPSISFKEANNKEEK